jgi:hypothetical protein
MLIALLFLVLFTGLTLEIMGTASANVYVSANERRSQQALALAESGMTVARIMLQEDREWEGGVNLSIPGSPGEVTITLVRFKSDPGLDYEDRLTVTSSADLEPAQRAVAMDFEYAEDDTVLRYGIASRSRLIVTGDTIIEGNTVTTWDRQDVAQAFVLDADSSVTGTVATIFSEEDFDDSGVEGEHGGIEYGNEPFEEYTADDFDTSSYRSGTSAIPDSSRRRWEWWPPGKLTGGFFRRDVHSGETYTNGRLPSGRDAVFENCTFNGITYIEDNNNVRFENCTFNGPIVTDVPQEFEWKNNALSFDDGNTWNNQVAPETTILAPNYNVNIGNLREVEGENAITGLLVGGIVDLRGNVTVNGSILSMYYPDPDEIGSSARMYGTNIGFYDLDAESRTPGETGRIRISIRPEYGLPFGVQTRYETAPIPSTYREVY